MTELIQHAFSPANIIPTILLLVCIFYGIMVILGALDISFLDFDIDADVDIDAEIDVDVDVDADTDVGSNNGGGLIGILKFFNIGDIPFMIFMCILSLSLWPLSITANYLLGNSSLLLGLLLLIPLLLVSLFITKILSTPLVKVFKHMNTAHKDVDLIGSIATIILQTSNQKIGQAEVVTHDNNSLVINVRATEDQMLTKGRQCLIIDRQEDGIYLVEAYEGKF